MISIYSGIVNIDNGNVYTSTLIHDVILKRNTITGARLSLREAVEIEPGSLNLLDGLGYSPLHWAARRQDMTSLDILLEMGADVQRRTLDERTALHLAAQRGHLEMMSRLVSAGSDVDAIDVNGCTPLHLAAAASNESSTAALCFLLESGCDVGILDRANHFTALNRLVHESLARDPWDCEGKIHALLKHGADIDTVDKWGCTPLLNASMIAWDSSVFGVLCDAGARKLVHDNSERGILHYAAAYGDLEHIEYLKTLRLTEDEVETGLVDRTGHTPSSLMRWRAGTSKRKLWTNMKAATEDEILAFENLINDIGSRKGTHATEDENDLILDGAIGDARGSTIPS